LVKDSTSMDRSYPSGSPSRQTVACKLSDVLYIIAQRIGVDQLRQHLTEPLQLFFAVFSITLATVSSDDMAKCQQIASANEGIVRLIILQNPVSSTEE